MKQNSTVWTLGGFDPTGFSGVLTDLEVFKSLKINASSIITAVTAQTNSAVSKIEWMSKDNIKAQYAALTKISNPLYIKISMIGDFDIGLQQKIILDPIIYASSGSLLIFDKLQDHIKKLITFLPNVELITPNLQEAEIILNRNITTYKDIEAAGKAFIDLGVRNVLIKGGHFHDSSFSQDYWTNGKEHFWLATQRNPIKKNVRGTGCSLASAITAALSTGYKLKDALVIAKMYVNRGIRKAILIEKYHYKLFHGAWPKQQCDLPYLSNNPLISLPKYFSSLSLGLYPVVDNSEWVKTLFATGVKCIQLRIKNSSLNNLKTQIKESIRHAKEYGGVLFVNDYWQLAIELGAPGVHLGQEDLLTADIDALHSQNLYLGISTHCYHEVATAHAFHPSYLAIGPIYPTTSKIMSFAPQGLQQLRYWRRLLQYPLVAIGGLNKARIPAILKLGVEGFAIISAITQSIDPITETKNLLTLLEPKP